MWLLLRGRRGYDYNLGLEMSLESRGNGVCLREDVVNDVVLDDAVENVASDEAEFAIDG